MIAQKHYGPRAYVSEGSKPAVCLLSLRRVANAREAYNTAASINLEPASDVRKATVRGIMLA